MDLACMNNSKEIVGVFDQRGSVHFVEYKWERLNWYGINKHNDNL